MRPSPPDLGMEVDEVSDSRPALPTENEADALGSMDMEQESCKRKGPDSRTVVLAPEIKKSRLEYVLEKLSSDQVTTRCQHELIGLHWMMSQVQTVVPDPPHV